MDEERETGVSCPCQDSDPHTRPKLEGVCPDSGVQVLAGEVVALHARVTDFCKASGIHYRSFDTSPTIVMRRADPIPDFSNFADEDD